MASDGVDTSQVFFVEFFVSRDLLDVQTVAASALHQARKVRFGERRVHLHVF